VLRKFFFIIATAGLCIHPLLYAQDTTGRSPDSVGVKRADSTSAPRAVADTAKVRAPADTAAPEAEKVRPQVQARTRGNLLEAKVIPWDWDEYTNVIEVALRDDKGREYSLTRNEEYENVFRLLGKKITFEGRAARDRDGFYTMTVTSKPQEKGAKEVADTTSLKAAAALDSTAAAAQISPAGDTLAPAGTPVATASTGAAQPQPGTPAQPSSASAAQVPAQAKGAPGSQVKSVPASSATQQATVQPQVAGETKPRLKFMPPKPEVPAEIVPANADLKMVLDLFITETGEVDPDKIKISGSSGYELVDTLVVLWARTLQFYPGLKNGKPAPMPLTLPVDLKSN